MNQIHLLSRRGLIAFALMCAAVPVARAQGPTFVIDDVVVAEGNAGASTATFTVSLLNRNSGESRVHFVTADGSASAAAAVRSSGVAMAIPSIGPASPYPATLNVSGLSGAIEHIAVRLDQLSHTSPADLDILLVGPGGQKVMVLSDRGITDDVVNISLTLQDGAPPPPVPLATGTWGPADNSPGDVMPAPAPAGPYGSELSVFTGTNPNGIWSLYVNDDQASDVGSLGGFSLIITTTGGGGDYVPAAGLLRFPPGAFTRSFQVKINGDTIAEPNEAFGVHLVAPFNAVIGDAQAIGTILNDDGVTTAQAPTDLYVSSIVGNQVTFRWEAPLVGPAPTTYLIEGGLAPGDVAATVPTGSVAPIVTLPVPPGSFYVRVRTVAGASASPPSNEVLVHVQTPTPPSAPVDLLGAVGTSRLGLTWHNTFEGGAPTSIILDVSGPITASVPVPVTDSFFYPNVPAGTYTFRVRAANAAGASAPSNPVTLTFPGIFCSELGPPTNFLAYRTGNIINVLWEPPAIGPAPTSYVLDVSGSATASIPTTSHALSGAVGPGTYVLSVRGANFCGSGAATAPQTIVVP